MLLKSTVGLIVVYLLSFSSLAATTTRLVYVSQFQPGPSNIELMKRRLDYALWAVIELMTVIMSANLPAMAALIRRGGQLKSRSSPQSSSVRPSSSKEGIFASLRNKSQSWFRTFTSTISGHVSNATGRSRSSASDTIISTDVEEEKKRKVSHDVQTKPFGTNAISDNYGSRHTTQIDTDGIRLSQGENRFGAPRGKLSEMRASSSRVPNVTLNAKVSPCPLLCSDNGNYLPPDFLESTGIRRTDEFVMARSEV